MIIRKCDLCGATIEEGTGLLDCELPAQDKEICCGKPNKEIIFYIGYKKEKKDICFSCSKKIFDLINRIQEENKE